MFEPESTPFSDAREQREAEEHKEAEPIAPGLPIAIAAPPLRTYQIGRYHSDKAAERAMNKLGELGYDPWCITSWGAEGLSVVYRLNRPEA